MTVKGCKFRMPYGAFCRFVMLIFLNHPYYNTYFSSYLLLLLSLLNSRTLTFTVGNVFFFFLRYVVNKTPHTSETFQKILLLRIKTVFSDSVSAFQVFFVFSPFSRAFAGLPTAPTTNGATATFIFHIFFSSWPNPTICQSSELPCVKFCVIRYNKINYLEFIVFSINDNHVRPSCSYKNFCLYSKISLKAFYKSHSQQLILVGLICIPFAPQISK